MSNYLFVEISYSIQVPVESLTENCLVLGYEPMQLKSQGDFNSEIKRSSLVASRLWF